MDARKKDILKHIEKHGCSGIACLGDYGFFLGTECPIKTVCVRKGQVDISFIHDESKKVAARMLEEAKGTFVSDSEILQAFAEECDRAERIHPDWPEDSVYQAAILSEEAGEVMKACLEHRFEPGKGVSMQDVVREAVQVGAMAFRFLKNIEGVDEILKGMKS